MALSNLPAYAQAFFSYEAKTTAAKTSHGDTVNAVLLFTAGPLGSRVRRITATPEATCGATGLYVYKSKDGSAATPCASSALSQAFNASASAGLPIVDLGPTPSVDMQFGPNEQCWVGMGVALAAGFGWCAEVSDF